MKPIQFEFCAEIAGMDSVIYATADEVPNGSNDPQEATGFSWRIDCARSDDGQCLPVPQSLITDELHERLSERAMEAILETIKERDDEERDDD